jgi:predicted RNase H-like nuclease (RuvC/YqgF family)
MAQIKMTVPDAAIEAASKNEIRRLKREVARKDEKIRTLETKLREIERTVGAARRVQTALRDFTSVMAEELNLDYDAYRSY